MQPILPTANLSTINQVWLNSCEQYKDRPVLCTRHSVVVKDKNDKKKEDVHYRQTTYGELEKMICAFGTGLIQLGISESDHVGVIAENSLRWMVCDMAVLGNRAANVPRGTTSTEEELVYILHFSGCRFIIVDNKEVLNTILGIKDRLPLLKTIIVLDDDFDETDVPSGIYSYNFVMCIGKNAAPAKLRLFKNRREAVLPSDIATLMFTSGTSGKPKGTPLMHGNFIHNMSTVPFLLKITSQDRFLTVLPIWHVLERTVEYMVLRIGASLWYTSVLSLIGDFGIVQPTFMVSVPRIWISVYNGFKKKLKAGGKEELFNKLYKHSLNVIRARRYKQRRQHLKIDESPVPCSAGIKDHFFHFLADLLIYSKIRKKTGSKLKGCISGGSSLPEYIDDFFEVAGITLLEGYGLTETSPVICVRTFDHRIPYTIGRPLPETNIKILDENNNEIPDSAHGVLWVSGPQVFSGYYKNKEESDKVITIDAKGIAWFNTGDIAFKTKTGDLTITGREKETIVLIGGENIEPSPIEDVLLSSEYIDQVMICGQDQEYLTLLLVPQKDELSKLCRERNIPFSNDQVLEACRHPEIREFYYSIINTLVAREKGYKEIELIHNFAFTEPFTPESGTFTRTFKVKRRKVFLRDEDMIKQMYPRYNDGGSRKGNLYG